MSDFVLTFAFFALLLLYLLTHPWKARSALDEIRHDLRPLQMWAGYTLRTFFRSRRG